MNIFLEELRGGLPDLHGFFRVIIRLAAAAILGAVIGAQRQHAGKPAGLRTHMLTAVACALFVLMPLQSQWSSADLSRVIQGIATGIGFLGGGAILKLSQEHEIKGITTAAGVWLTASIGVAVGLGGLGIALLGTLLAWIILSILGQLEHRSGKETHEKFDGQK